MGINTHFPEAPDDQIQVAPWLVALMNAKPLDDRIDPELAQLERESEQLQRNVEFYARAIEGDTQIDPSVRDSLVAQLRSSTADVPVAASTKDRKQFLRERKGRLKDAIQHAQASLGHEEKAENNENDVSHGVADDIKHQKAEAKRTSVMNSISEFAAKCTGKDKQCPVEKKSEKPAPEEVKQTIITAQKALKQVTDHGNYTDVGRASRALAKAEAGGNAALEHVLDSAHRNMQGAEVLMSGRGDSGNAVVDTGAAVKRNIGDFWREMDIREFLDQFNREATPEMKAMYGVAPRDTVTLEQVKVHLQDFDMSMIQIAALKGNSKLSYEEFIMANKAMVAMSKLTEADVKMIGEMYGVRKSYGRAGNIRTLNDLREVLNYDNHVQVISLDKNGDGYITRDEVDGFFKKQKEQSEEFREAVTKQVAAVGDKLAVVRARTAFGGSILNPFDQVTLDEAMATFKKNGITNVKKSAIDTNHDGKLDDGELVKAAEILNKQMQGKASEVRGTPSAGLIASTTSKTPNRIAGQG